MRRLIVLLLAGFAAASHAFTEQIRVTTWNLSFPPGGSTASAPAGTEEKRLREAAAVLKSFDADVILLQDVRDRQFCNRLASFLKPATYYVLACSAFQDGAGTLARGQVAILSRRPAFGAWAEHWKQEAAVEPPGGFAFAAIRFGTVDVGFYSIQLQDNQTRGNQVRETQFNILKREMCARQLARHVAAVEGKITNPAKGFVIAGDLNSHPDQGLLVAERTWGVLEESGFRNLVKSIPIGNRDMRPGASRLPAATFDYIFAKNADSIGTIQIVPARIADRLPMACTLVVPATAPGSGRSTLPILGVTPEELARDKRLWLGAGAVALLFLAGAAVRRAGSQKKSAPEYAVTQFADAYASQRHRRPSLGDQPMRREKELFPRLSPAPDFADEESTLWQKRARDAERRAEQATAMVKAGLLPHLAQLLRDKLFWKLIRQRSRLLQTQYSGEQLIAEFEERLAGVQSQFQTCMRSYERRIEELQREIANKELELVRIKETAMRETQERVGASPWPPVFKS